MFIFLFLVITFSRSCFATTVRQWLQEHKRRMVEAKRRDHRVLGKKLDLFSLQEDAGGGLVRGDQNFGVFWVIFVRNRSLAASHALSLGVWTAQHPLARSQPRFESWGLESAASARSQPSTLVQLGIGQHLIQTALSVRSVGAKYLSAPYVGIPRGYHLSDLFFRDLDFPTNRVSCSACMHVRRETRSLPVCPYCYCFVW